MSLPLCQTDTATLQARETELRRELARIEYELAVRELPPAKPDHAVRIEGLGQLPDCRSGWTPGLDSSLAHR